MSESKWVYVTAAWWVQFEGDTYPDSTHEIFILNSDACEYAEKQGRKYEIKPLLIRELIK